MIFLLFYLLSLIQTCASFLLSSFLSFKALQIYQFNFFIQVPHVIHVLEMRRMKDLKIPQKSVKVLANNLTNITPHVNWFRDVLNFNATVKSVGEIFTKMRFIVFRVCYVALIITFMSRDHAFKEYSSLLFETYFIVLYWNTPTSSQVSNCDGVVLEIYLDHKFQWPQEDLNCESLAYEVVS